VITEEDDILLRPRVLRALAAMRRAEPEVTTASMFQKSTIYSPAAAAKARKWLLDRDYITVQEGTKSKVPYVHMRLTEKGKRLADHALKIAELHERDGKHKG